MKVGLDILAVRVGEAAGIETYTRAFLKTLDRANQGQHSYYVFTTRNNLDLRDPRFRHLDFVLFPGSNERRWLRVLMQQALIPYYALRLKLDVVNFQSNLASLLLPCASVLHIKTLHHYQHPESIPPGQMLVRKALFNPSAGRADLIIANTRNTKRDICRYLNVPSDKVVIIPEGVDTEVFFPCRGGNGHIQAILGRYGIRKPYILFVSALWPYKNARTLIRAYAWLLEEHRSLTQELVLVGGDANNHMAELRALAEELGIAQRVKFVGQVGDRSIVRCFYAGADVFVYPSLYETFGLTTLEAMACGTPVVASNSTSLPEVVGDAGLLVDPEDVVQMGRAIYRVLKDDELRRDLIARGLERATRFSWERTVTETVQVYEQAVSLHSAKR